MFQVEINSKKQDEDDNPFSVDQIEPRLWLGNVTAACNLNFLKIHSISNILTIESFPLPNYVASSLNVTIKYIQIADMARENIIQYFSEAIDFIENALKDPKGTNGVLVHCFYGVSRSSTLVIAYLMKKYNLTYQKAFERVKSKRSLCHPNRGFIQQLKLFYKMNYTIDPHNKYYKVFRLKLAAEKIKSAKILPSNFHQLIQPDPGVMQEYPEPYVYRCRKCRRVVASKSNLILHKIPKDEYESPSSKRKSKTDSTQKYLNNLASDSGDHDAIIDITDKVLTTSLSDRSLSEIDKGDVSTAQEYCEKIYFIEPIAWMMKEVINNAEGKLHCPTCRTKIGAFNWIMASKCPCGAQVAPSFYLVPSKIDFSNIVQNIVQVTI